ncbi:MAG TPA: hypothetical protein VLG68_10505 [Gammaproteobacteria bacterium]|nr:hypothetical protein [Gammaproteobacteria bacterium]
MKSLSSFFVLAFGFMAALPTQAGPKVEKGLLSTVLPNVVILFDSEKDLPVFVRIVRVAGDSECQEPSEQCEQDDLYVVISDNEREPVTSVTYHLDKAHEWTVQSVSRCSGLAEELCAKITLDQGLFDEANKRWKSVHHIYEFRMDSVKEVGITKK